MVPVESPSSAHIVAEAHASASVRVQVLHQCLLALELALLEAVDSAEKLAEHAFHSLEEEIVRYSGKLHCVIILDGSEGCDLLWCASHELFQLLVCDLLRQLVEERRYLRLIAQNQHV